MKIIPDSFFKSIRKDMPKECLPKSKNVGIYEMACMIAKKTKFRVSDIQEVLEEVGPCIYGILLNRKTANFGNIVISSRWNRLKYPRFVRNDEGYWVFGYYLPGIQFDKMCEKMYYASDAVYTEDFLQNLKYYFSNEIESVEEAKEKVNNIISETSKQGKHLVVDENSYIKPIPDLLRQAKIYKFDEEFHPSWFEKQKFFNVRRHYIKEMKKLRESNPEIDYKWVIEQLKKDGFIKFEDNDLEESSDE